MRSKAAALYFAAILGLAVSAPKPGLAQQPTEETAKQIAPPALGTVYEDTQWSPDQDIEMLKSNIRSQKKQIVAANMDLTDGEAEKFWPVYDRYAADLAKIYDTKIAL